MSDNPCETARHHDMVNDCRESKHALCERCNRCYTCAVDSTRIEGEKLALAVREWELNNPQAYRREE